MAHGIAVSQSFIDGNKRLALVAMLTFLELGDYRVDPPDTEEFRPQTRPNSPKHP